MKDPILDAYWKYRMIFDGIERNILVYDSECEGGVLTNRLIFLMKTVANNNNIGKMSTVYIPKYEWTSTLIESPFADKEYFGKFGITIEECEDQTEKFLNLEGSLVDKKKYIVIGECSSSEDGYTGTILGCY